MKTFNQYIDSRELATSLIEQQIDVNEYCDLVLKLVGDNNLNEASLIKEWNPLSSAWRGVQNLARGAAGVGGLAGGAGQGVAQGGINAGKAVGGAIGNAARSIGKGIGNAASNVGSTVGNSYQQSADMQSIKQAAARIDGLKNALNALGYSNTQKLKNITIGAIENLLAKWQQLYQRGINPRTKQKGMENWGTPQAAPQAVAPSQSTDAWQQQMGQAGMAV